MCVKVGIRGFALGVSLCFPQDRRSQGNFNRSTAVCAIFISEAKAFKKNCSGWVGHELVVTR